MVAQAILFAVESPKSNAAAVAINRVMEAIDEIKSAEVPLHLRDAHYRGAKNLGHVGYKYPHDYPGHYVRQQYLPDKLQGRTFYEASNMGMEEKIRLNQEKRKQL
jgi:putative ATPase